MYGWRGRIGVIVPSLNVTIEPEFNAMAPEGVSIHATRVLLEKGTAEALRDMAGETERAAQLLATAGVDIIAYACTTGSLVGGPGWNQELIKRIESKTNIRATTTATAVVLALKELAVARVAVGTPYLEELNQLEKAFLEAHGIKVVHIEGLGFTGASELNNLDSGVAYALGKKVDREEAQALFLSCTGFQTLEIIEALGQDLGKPVLTSNTATLWDILRRLKVKEPVVGYGEIFHRI